MKLMKLNEHPPITISPHDYEQLERIAMAGIRTRRHSYVAQFLADELERARVVPAHEIGEKVVTMYSDVSFRENATREIRRVTLVYPGEEDIAFGRISILTPVGTALIGLTEGQSLSWQTVDGEPRRLTVMQVHSQSDTPPMLRDGS